jgi:hypothetical protein
MAYWQNPSMNIPFSYDFCRLVMQLYVEVGLTSLLFSNFLLSKSMLSISKASSL